MRRRKSKENDLHHDNSALFEIDEAERRKSKFYALDQKLHSKSNKLALKIRHNRLFAKGDILSDEQLEHGKKLSPSRLKASSLLDMGRRD